MKYSKDQKGTTAGGINDEVGEDPVEQNIPASQIGTAVAAIWNAG
jgi:hypothetical protein